VGDIHVLFLHMDLQYSRQVMGSVTGVELDGESCVLVRVRPADEVVRLLAVDGTASPAWEAAAPFADSLRRARRCGFPRHAVLVAWDLDEAASVADPRTRVEIAPLVDAGFAVDAVVSPIDALCALAQRRRTIAGREGEVWLALNRRRVAMAIVEDGRLLYSRRFDWHYSPGATQRAELLQRYSLVAHLAIEVRHGIDVVSAEHGRRVNAIVTCGDLPDLRSLTMPLIEELDIEVETLDTLDGIVVEGAATGDAIAGQAPAIRLACAAAASAAPVTTGGRWWLVAAAVVLLAVLAGAWTMMRTLPGSPAATRPGEPSRQSDAAPATPPAAPTATDKGETPSDRSAAQGADPVNVPRPPQAQVPAAKAGLPVESPAATTGRTPAPDRPAPAPAAQRPAPLSTPLPVVNSIMVAPDRRLAVLDGEIVREGDAVGARVVVRIERRAVVLREPSGREVTVPIRRRSS
jgi:hypothetical protein